LCIVVFGLSRFYEHPEEEPEPRFNRADRDGFEMLAATLIMGKTATKDPPS